MNQLANIWQRLGALLIDISIFIIALVLLLIISFGTGISISIVLPFILWVVIPAQSGQTIGKCLFRIRIERPDRTDLGYGWAFIRLCGYGINCITIGAGFVVAIFRKDKRGLHDLIAGTQVVKVVTQQNFQPQIITRTPTSIKFEQENSLSKTPVNPSETDSKILLLRLNNLYKRGILTETEYEEQRQKLNVKN